GAGNADVEPVLGAEHAAKKLEQIVIAPFMSSFPAGSHVPLSTTAIYSDQSHEEVSDRVSWSISDQSSALISDNRNLELLSAGSITVTASLEGVIAPKQITITDATLDSIDIVPKHLDIASGLQQTYQAFGNYSDGSSYDISHQVEWQSDNSQVIEFTQANATTKAAGEARILATMEGETGQATATVNNATLEGIAFATVNPTLEVGFQLVMQVSGFFSDSSTLDISDQVVWSVDDSSVATIDDSTSTLTGMSAGSVRLKASFSGFSVEQLVSVSQEELTGIEISPGRVSIAAGQQVLFYATAVFGNQTSRDITALVTWGSSDELVASIDNRLDHNGKATSFKPGTTGITATYSGHTTNVVLTVTDADLTNIAVSPASISLTQGMKHDFVATAFFSDGSQELVTDQVTWSSTSNIITAVSGQSNGQFQTSEPGEALVVATLHQKQGYAQVKVSAVTLKSIYIDNTTISQALGTTQLLTLYGEFSDGSILDLTQQASWTSNSTDVAVVSNSDNRRGELSGVGVGATVIYAHAGGQEATLGIEITAAVLQRIELSSSTQSLRVNQSGEILARGTFSDKSTQDLTAEVFWTSTNSDIASVSNMPGSAGLLTTTAPGTATIQASLSGIDSTRLSVNVTDDPNYPASISIRANPNVIINNGSDSTTIEIVVKPLQAHGVIADGTEVSFVILENQVTRIINSDTLNGVASFDLTSTTQGIILVTAEIDDTELNAATAVLSTSDFINVLQIIPVAKFVFTPDGKTFVKDSAFAVLMRNLSNRDFDLEVFDMSNGGSSLPGLPVTEAIHLSGGVLEGGEYIALGYSLDEDTINNTISASCKLFDEPTQTTFGFSIEYNF
ncbi:MAG: hypothetical protein GY784_01590, partial [Gammaproteobacteria bacterium]|nr:hypothetical protein [Gammaproteobacteria bacterium]